MEAQEQDVDQGIRGKCRVSNCASLGADSRAQDKLLDGWTPEAKGKNTDAKNGLKRPSDEPESPRQKRRKLAPEPRTVVKREQSGKNTKAKKAAARRTPEADEESDEGSPASHKSRPRQMKDGSEDEGKDSEDQDVPAAQSNKDSKDKDDSSAEDGHAEPPPKAADGDAVAEEQYSDVIDEAPQPKRRKRDKKEASSKPSKAVSKKISASTANDADDVEIKKLQSQLVKCGVRKLWHNELKRYGDDGRAKIRHLKKMLAEIGMSGRFSEAKAREIKEMREILADAEAAQEMNRLWGMSNDGRASRSKNKRAKTEESDGSVADGKRSVRGGDGDEGNDGNDKGDDEDDDDDAGNTFAARRRRAQADLAFLGDDSDSD